MEKLMTLDEVATSLGLCEKTVRTRLIREEGLPCIRLGRRLRFESDQVREWLRRRAQVLPTPQVSPEQKVIDLGFKDRV